MDSVCSHRTQFSDRRKLVREIEQQVKLERARLNVSFQVKMESESVWNASELFDPGVPGHGFAIYRTENSFAIHNLEKMPDGGWQDSSARGLDETFSTDGRRIQSVANVVAQAAAKVLIRTVRGEKARVFSERKKGKDPHGRVWRVEP